MKIFVGYGYNERDRWIEGHIFDLIRAFGGEPVTGKEIFGEQLEDGVRQQIKDCDALLAFTTRRKKTADGKYTTHQWVTDEIVTAMNAHIPFVEVRETSVDRQPGMPGGRQYIPYDAAARDVCLIEIAKAIGKFRQQLPLSLQLVPEAVTRAIRPYIGKPGFHCSYKIYKNGVESAATETIVTPRKGGLFVLVSGVSSLASVQISIEAGGKIWTSDYESIDAVSVELREA
jgi:hypothetical protein